MFFQFMFHLQNLQFLLKLNINFTLFASLAITLIFATILHHSFHNPVWFRKYLKQQPESPVNCSAAFS